jgi:hypothetical protein
MSAKSWSQKRLFGLWYLCAAFLLPTALKAQPAERLDQSFMPSGSAWTVSGCSPGCTAVLAQTFTVGSAGFLTGVDVTFDVLQQSLTVSILPVAAGSPVGTPPNFSTALGTVTITDLQTIFQTIPHIPAPTTGFLHVDFGDEQIRVQPGDVYAIALTGRRSFSDGVSSWIDTNNRYSRGGFYDWALSPSGPFWREREGDLAFRTFLSPIPEPETYAMLLTGLALLGVAMRRRSA